MCDDVQIPPKMLENASVPSYNAKKKCWHNLLSPSPSPVLTGPTIHEGDDLSDSEGCKTSNTSFLVSPNVWVKGGRGGGEPGL